MKKILYLTGLIAASFIIIGSIFKTFHYPGASLLLILGIFIFCFVAIPLFVAYRIRKKRDKFDLVATWVIAVTLWFLFLGLMFAVQHYPGAGFMLLIAKVLALFGLLPVAFKSFSRSGDPYKGMNLLAILTGVAGILLVSNMNYARNTLQGYRVTYFQQELGNDRQEQSNKRMADRLFETESKAERAEQIHAMTQTVLTDIENVQIYLISTAEKVHPDVASRMSINDLSWPDNADVPTQILIGPDWSNPSEDEYSALFLKMELENLAAAIRAELSNPAMQVELDKELESFFRTYNLYDEPWVIENFLHSNIVASMHVLESMQGLALSMEARALEDLAAQ